MASHESYYASPLASPITSAPPPPAPPPPPPKPSSFSQESSRSGTPLHTTAATTTASATATPSPQVQLQSQPPNQPHSDSHSESLLQQQHQHQQQYQPIPPPSKSDQWLPEGLSDHTITDLQELLSKPSLVNALASQSHPSYASSTVPVTALLQSNAALAQQVAVLESQLRHLRHDTAQILLKHSSLQTQWRRKQREVDDALSPWGPRAMYQRLVSSVSEQEALLAAMTDSFLDLSGASPPSDLAYYQQQHDPHHDGSATRLASDKEVVDWLRRLREGTATLEKRREMRARWDEGRVGGWR